MTVVLDTSVLIDVLRGNAAALEFLRGIGEVPVCSEVTRVEIARGLRSRERRSTEELFRALTWRAVDEAIARRAGELGRRWDRHRPGIGLADLVIAATTEDEQGDLATANVGHFPMFAGLKAHY